MCDSGPWRFLPLHLVPNIEVEQVPRLQVQKVATIEDVPTEVQLKTLEHIFQCLPLADIKSCRLVNSTWKRASLLAARAKSGPVPLPVEKTSTWGAAKRLIDCINDAADSFPSENFEVKINLYTMFMSTPLVGMFVKATYDWVKELTISILYIETGLGYHAPPGMRIELNFRSLKSFTLKLKYGVAGDGQPVDQNIRDRELAAIIQYATSFIGTAPHLENVTLDIGDGITDRRLLPNSIDALGIGQPLQMRITSLSLAIRLDDLDWKTMISKNLPLKSLRLYTKRTLANMLDTCYVEQFLGSVSETLSLLEIHDNRGGEQILYFLTFPFPTMKNLKKLKISSSTGIEQQAVPSLKFRNIVFHEQFPALEELCLRDLDGCVVTDCFLRPDDPIVPLVTLKSLALPQMSNDPDYPPMYVISELFPNLKSLHLWPTCDTIYEDVVAFLPQLEELSYATHWGYVHFLFFPECVKQETVDGKETNENAFSFKALKNLKILRFENNSKTIFSGLGFSKESVELLMEMKSLQLLDLSKWPLAFPLYEEDGELLELMRSKFIVRLNAAS